MSTRQAERETLALPGLIARLSRAEGFADVLAALAEGKPATIDGAWGSSRALTVAALAERARGPVLAVLPRMSEVDDFAADMAGFTGEAPLVFPAWETLPREQSVADAIFGGRLRVLNALSDKRPPRVIVTCLPALMQPVPSRSERQSGTRVLQTGDELDIDGFLRWLSERGF